MEENEQEVQFGQKKYYSRKICMATIIFGVLSLILCWVPILGLIISLTGLILALVANVKRIKDKEEKMGCTIFGFIAGIIGTVVGATVFFIIIFDVIFDLNLFHRCDTAPRSIIYSQSDINAYNATVMNYASKETLNGADIISMIQEIITQNSQYVDESKKFISIHAKNISGYHNEDYLDEVGRNANALESENGENNQTNINEAKEEYIKLIKKIESSKKYKVNTTADSIGIIYAIEIEEL